MHYGLTSSDVVDTALSLQLTRAADLLIDAADRARRARSPQQAHEYRDTPMVGRTHGIHAEPTTFGVKLALWALQVRRDVERLRRARAGDRGRQALRRGRHVLERRPVRGAARLRARSGSRRCRPPRCSPATGTPSCSTRARASARRVEQFATRDPPPPAHRGPRGRGAVPGREAEGLLGDAAQAQPGEERAAQRARAGAARATSVAGLENVALWHERDISHSSVERVILPDSCLLAYYLLVKFRSIVEGMHVYPERMLENLDASYGLVFSQPVLLALVGVGPVPRRRVPDGAAQRDDAPGRSGARSSTCCARTRRSPTTLDRRAARRLLRPEAGDRQRRPHLRGARRADRRGDR